MVGPDVDGYAHRYERDGVVHRCAGARRHQAAAEPRPWREGDQCAGGARIPRPAARLELGGLGCTAMNELLGIVIFSGFMLVVVAALVGNVLLALYRERSQRKRGPEAPGGPAGE